ncbi:MAG: hypothetical protein HY859_19940 [Caulobacterales bacterium]|nr:hypothetical protein [Caulobacterales bacterium]
MAPLLFALALILQDAPAEAAPSPDAPMATAVPRKQAAAPLPIQGGAVSAPTDDYGYVGWCYGAISSYVELYDRAMPEVIRIERAWPTPSTEENIAQVYPAQREEGKRNLVLFARAMQAAEKASPTPIQDQGADAVRRGRAMWTGATSVPKAQLAQFWMSWSPPAKCEETAKALEAKSLLFGQALSYNANGGTPVVAPPPAEAPPGMAPASPSGAGSAALAPAELEPALALVATPEAPAEAMPSGETLMVETTPMPSDDPEVELQGDDSAGPTEPIIDAAALSAGAPAAEGDQVITVGADPDRVRAAPTDGIAEAPPTAIDDLLPTEEAAPEAFVAEPEPVAAPPAPPVEPATPAPPKRKRGLKETLQGMRGPQ